MPVFPLAHQQAPSRRGSSGLTPARLNRTPHTTTAHRHNPSPLASSLVPRYVLFSSTVLEEVRPNSSNNARLQPRLTSLPSPPSLPSFTQPWPRDRPKARTRPPSGSSRASRTSTRAPSCRLSRYRRSRGREGGRDGRVDGEAGDGGRRERVMKEQTHHCRMLAYMHSS
jgi:hypothetical protein